MVFSLIRRWLFASLCRDGQRPDELRKSWHRNLDGVKHPWQHAKGPIGALQCYLREHGWDHDQFDRWSKPGYNGMEAWKSIFLTSGAVPEGNSKRLNDGTEFKD